MLQLHRDLSFCYLIIHNVFIDSASKNGSMKARLLRDRPCLLLEKEAVSFVTLFVPPEAETMEATRMKKTRMLAVLRAFLESIQVCASVRITKIDSFSVPDTEL